MAKCVSEPGSPVTVEDASFELRAACTAMFMQTIEGHEGMTDMRFLLVDGSDFQIGGHKGFLSSRSSYVRGLFESGMQEAKVSIVPVRDCSKSSFLAFLEFVYTGTIELSSRVVGADGWELWHLADLFGIEGLKRWLGNRMSEVEVAGVSLLASEAGDEELLAACRKCASACLPHIPAESLQGLPLKAATELMHAHPCPMVRLRFLRSWCEVNAPSSPSPSSPAPAHAPLEACLISELSVMMATELNAILEQGEEEGLFMVLSLANEHCQAPSKIAPSSATTAAAEHMIIDGDNMHETLTRVASGPSPDYASACPAPGGSQRPQEEGHGGHSDGVDDIRRSMQQHDNMLQQALALAVRGPLGADGVLKHICRALWKFAKEHTGRRDDTVKRGACAIILSAMDSCLDDAGVYICAYVCT
jgi:hypothetical protein